MSSSFVLHRRPKAYADWLTIEVQSWLNQAFPRAMIQNDDTDVLDPEAANRFHVGTRAHNQGQSMVYIGGLCGSEVLSYRL